MMKYKLSDVAKDLNVSNKEVADVLKDRLNTVKKPTTALTEEELNIVFEHFTQAKSVSSFEAYFASANEPEAPAAEAASADKPEKTEKTDKPQKAEKAEKPDKEQKTDKPADNRDAAKKQQDRQNDPKDHIPFPALSVSRDHCRQEKKSCDHDRADLNKIKQFHDLLRPLIPFLRGSLQLPSSPRTACLSAR